ncbi:urease accessory protein UreF [Pararhizobium mangrovi]|uniref:Urease accessory protein UreF n=1 Tax=Pararhizobium mangrovi TaxID=2590452 RepID=A0A506U712_9HYPH|nr:urease accessory UreF family protein [Pararhizobium mangrovi]TPW29288.1 urease accessory protein UreF [Pararhizobium mangrovi]
MPPATEPVAEPAARVRLMTLLSPSFPVGAFAYSHGVERAVHDGLIGGRDDLVAWLGDLVTAGSGWNDAVLLRAAWGAGDARERDDIASLAEALASSRERHLETMAQGSAFLAAARAFREARDLRLEGEVAYPVAVGAVTRAMGLACAEVLAAYLNAFVGTLVQAALRTVPIGQSDAVAALARLEPVVLDAAARAEIATLDDLGSATVVSDLLAMTHETQQSRLFRS